jgi:hypothetical protein
MPLKERMHVKKKPQIAPKSVRYIKLGEGGLWERECSQKGIIRLHFGTSSSERFELCRRGKWGEAQEQLSARRQKCGYSDPFHE